MPIHIKESKGPDTSCESHEKQVFHEPFRNGGFVNGEVVACGSRTVPGKFRAMKQSSCLTCTRETKRQIQYALNHATMKGNPIPTLMGLCLCWLCGSLQMLAREPSRNLQDLVKLESKVAAVSRKVAPATVALLSEQTGSSGSGVVASEDGLILTAAHVVQGADSLLVVFPDGKQVQGKVLGANYSKDIAMVKITSPGKWPCATMGASKSLAAGDWVLALGHSTGFDAGRPPPVRFGRVVSKGPGNFLTTDCTLIGGDSGGPLFDLNGNIIAIHSSIGQSLTNNNHAGIDGFRDDWDRILAGETWGALSMNPFANPEMPVLGIGMAMMRGVKGVIVESVVPGSPAAAAGVRAGDLIRSLDGSAVDDGGELLQMLAKRQAGDAVKLGVLRDKESLEVKVTLKRRNELYEQR
jgi:serine protease Do